MTETSRVWHRQWLRSRKPVEFDAVKGFVHGNQSSLMPPRASFTKLVEFDAVKVFVHGNQSSLTPSRASYTETSQVWCRQGLRTRKPVEFDAAKGFVHKTCRVWCRQGLRTRKPVEFDAVNGFVHQYNDTGVLCFSLVGRSSTLYSVKRSINLLPSMDNNTSDILLSDKVYLAFMKVLVSVISVVLFSSFDPLNC